MRVALLGDQISAAMRRCVATKLPAARIYQDRAADCAIAASRRQLTPLSNSRITLSFPSTTSSTVPALRRFSGASGIMVSRSPLRSLWNLEGIPISVIAKHTWRATLDDNLVGRAAELGFYFIFRVISESVYRDFDPGPGCPLGIQDLLFAAWDICRSSYPMRQWARCLRPSTKPQPTTTSGKAHLRPDLRDLVCICRLLRDPGFVEHGVQGEGDAIVLRGASFGDRG